MPRRRCPVGRTITAIVSREEGGDGERHGGDGEGVVASEVVPVAMAAAGSEAVVARAAAMGVGGVAAVEVVLAVASWASNASALQRNGA